MCIGLAFPVRVVLQNPFQIFPHFENVQNSNLLSDIRFCQYVSYDIFRYYLNFGRIIRSEALYPNFYITLYPNYIAFTKEEAEVQKQALPCVPARYIRSFDAFSERERHLLGVEIFHNVLSILQKVLELFKPYV